MAQQPRYVRLEPDDGHAPPMQIKRSTMLSIRVNLVAFLILGSIAIYFDETHLRAAANSPKGTITWFLVLAPLWVGGTHYLWRMVRGLEPSIARSFWFAIKWTAIVGVVLYFRRVGYKAEGVVPYGVMLLLGYCCFLTFALVNGVFGPLFAAFNTGLIAMKLHAGERIDPLLWFNLLGLVDISSAAVQWSLLAVTVTMGLSERTFRVLEYYEA